MKLINCTPYDIVYESKDRTIREIYPYTGQVPKVKVRYEMINEDPLIQRVTRGEITGMPDPESDTYFLVSRMVAAAATDRNDLLVPADFKRDNGGAIMACRCFEAVR